MNLKKIIVLLTTFLCTLHLTACYPNGEETVTKGNVNTIAINSEALEENVIVTNEMLIINVDLSEAEKYDGDYAMITVKLKPWDDGIMQNLFVDGKTVIEESEYEADLTSGTVHKNYSMENSWNLSYENGRVTYRNIDVNSGRLYSYFASAAFWQEHNMVLEETFDQNELNFMTKSEAQKIVDNIVASLEINDIEIMGIYSMDASDVNAISENENTILRDGSAFENWTANDEAYIVIYKFKKDGINISEYGVNFQSRGFDGSYIMGIVNKDGIVDLNMQMVYDDVSAGEKVKICSADTALNALVSKYENIILKNPIEVSECRLNYAAVNKNENNNTYTLSPVWTFTLRETVDSTDWYSVELVDALTGQILD